MKKGSRHTAAPTWPDLAGIGREIEDDMVEVPEGDVSLGGRVFHVGKFRISRTPVTVSLWNRVMGLGGPPSDTPIAGISFEQFIPFRQRLNRARQAPGKLNPPTEAQLERALQTKSISLDGNAGEVCITLFREYGEMGGDHMLDNIPRNLPADLVVRCGDGARLSVRSDRNSPPDGSGRPVGFRLAMTMYDVPPASDDDFSEAAKRLAGLGVGSGGTGGL